MYLQHFGMNQLPFKNVPDTRFFYRGCDRGAILEAIQYAICSGSGIIKVVGEVGTGKTFLCHKLAEMLPNDIDIIYIANPSLPSDLILHYIAHELGFANALTASKLEIMQQIVEYLLDQYKRNRTVVMLVEEAQSMPTDTLEEIRLLSNLETSQDKLLQIVLFGQPELDQNLSQPDIRQLNERIQYNITLPALNADEVYDYVNFRLKLAGYSGKELFSKSMAQRITKSSEGLIRRINGICDKMLLSSYSQSRHHVTKSDFKFATQECAFMSAPPTALSDNKYTNKRTNRMHSDGELSDNEKATLLERFA